MVRSTWLPVVLLIAVAGCESAAERKARETIEAAVANDRDEILAGIARFTALVEELDAPTYASEEARREIGERGVELWPEYGDPSEGHDPGPVVVVTSDRELKRLAGVDPGPQLSLSEDPSRYSTPIGAVNSLGTLSKALDDPEHHWRTNAYEFMRAARLAREARLLAVVRVSNWTDAFVSGDSFTTGVCSFSGRLFDLDTGECLGEFSGAATSELNEVEVNTTVSAGASSSERESAVNRAAANRLGDDLKIQAMSALRQAIDQTLRAPVEEVAPER